MLLVIGYLVVIGSMLGGFYMAGGSIGLLMHASEFVVIGGIALGVLIVASPPSTLKAMGHAILNCFTHSGIKKEEYMELLKLLYEIFLVGRRNGLIALDEHISDPKASSIFSKYPTFVNNPERLNFLCNGLRPVVDGKIKPDQLEDLLYSEIETRELEAQGPTSVLTLVADSLPGIGIIAAVLGIINTMTAIAEGPATVGEKVAAALTGTFLGVLGAYGFVSPLNKRIHFNEQVHFLYFYIIAKAVAGFAKGLAPIMAIEVVRRMLPKEAQINADELETMLKNIQLPKT